ncbi:uncharacterized protein DDB_G0271670-like, partial [Bactrocera neohumeralis]|uniref:uncharacterized protein DDB_G0271670-like n=1 Tax=Bactrocera neohumeralis TaxID=98809 RepID=UPI0021661D78
MRASSAERPDLSAHGIDAPQSNAGALSEAARADAAAAEEKETVSLKASVLAQILHRLDTLEVDRDLLREESLSLKRQLASGAQPPSMHCPMHSAARCPTATAEADWLLPQQSNAPNGRHDSLTRVASPGGGGGGAAKGLPSCSHTSTSDYGSKYNSSCQLCFPSQETWPEWETGSVSAATTAATGGSGGGGGGGKSEVDEFTMSSVAPPVFRSIAAAAAHGASVSQISLEHLLDVANASATAAAAGGGEEEAAAGAPSGHAAEEAEEQSAGSDAESLATTTTTSSCATGCTALSVAAATGSSSSSGGGSSSSRQKRRTGTTTTRERRQGGK